MIRVPMNLNWHSRLTGCGPIRRWWCGPWLVQQVPVRLMRRPVRPGRRLLRVRFRPEVLLLRVLFIVSPFR